MNFRDYSSTHDLHNQSHRALTKLLIPDWLARGVKDLDSLIESSGYGESPEDVLGVALHHLELQKNDVFLDLGAGAGNVVSLAYPLCRQAVGIERNPKLVELGQSFLQTREQNCQSLREGDFLISQWPDANKLFAATARFSESTLKALAKRLVDHDPARRVAILGRSLPMPQPWSVAHQQSFEVRWNPGEALLSETLEVWVRQP